ncbi:uncharacterized protein J7T54_004443 [Emericellopsis cladophorae]|uniref:Uncharacterized protein n=1 Tax=Emericellopsis cladophorae TaxID=2686198 RepID=A0A9P9Y4N8_9HYPO|nr:uncharacterized protein J7T54_004443 [Emericellopsis cladophorae]KAI6783416.1 hypothetical protein J7T54_004443 [Emericellopsis cladophorae]
MKTSTAGIAAFFLFAGSTEALFWWFKPPVWRPLTLNLGGLGGGGGGGGSACNCPAPICPGPTCPDPDCPKNGVYAQREADLQSCPAGDARFDKMGNFVGCA